MARDVLNGSTYYPFSYTDKLSQKWKNLRDYYVSKKKENKKPSGAAAERKTKWKFYDIMDAFLAPYVASSR